MKKIILNTVVILLKMVYFPMKFMKIQNKAVYISRQSNKESLDFKMIKQTMEDLYPNIKNVLLTKKIESGIFNKISYVFHMLVQMYNIATAKIVILDGYCIVACCLKHKKETKIIQIWHALGAIKKFGYQSINKKDSTDETTAKIMNMHKNYNYVLAPSEETAKYYKQAFNIKNEQIKYIGLPRIDYILKSDEKTKQKIYMKYPELKEKTNILYVPTFRKGEKIALDELVEKIDTDKYNLIIKLHPLDIEKYQYKEKQGVIYEKEIGTYDLLKISDKIITDYSSLSIESSLLDKEIYFYTYDIDKYQEAPGLNLDFSKEEIGKYQAENVNDLLKILEQEYDKNILENFKNKYITINKEDCTRQLVRFIVEELYYENKKSSN